MPAQTATVPVQTRPARATTISQLLQQASSRIRTLHERELSAYGMTAKHFAITTAILERGPMTQQALSRLLGIDRTTMVKLVDDLERLGVAFRDVHPTDRRAFEVDVTPEGDIVFHEASHALATAEKSFFQSISGEERRLLQQVLTRLVDS